MSLIVRIISQDPVGMEQLRAVRRLALPDWCIAAGFVRNRVWDHLHGIAPPRAPADIDVLYYDAADLSKESEARYEQRLGELLPGLPWQVRNQARMHVWKGLPQHKLTLLWGLNKKRDDRIELLKIYQNNGMNCYNVLHMVFFLY